MWANTYHSFPWMFETTILYFMHHFQQSILTHIKYTKRNYGRSLLWIWAAALGIAIIHLISLLKREVTYKCELLGPQFTSLQWRTMTLTRTFFIYSTHVYWQDSFTTFHIHQHSKASGGGWLYELSAEPSAHG